MTVGLVIVSHSTQLASGVVELAAQMTQGKTPLAAAGGGIDDIIGTSADKILAAIQSVANPDGVLILLDLGSAILSAELALEFLDEEQRARVALTYAPLIEGTITAAVEASLGRTLAQVKHAAENMAHTSQLQQLKPISAGNSNASEEMPSAISPIPSFTSDTTATTDTSDTSDTIPIIETQLTITNPAGLHARPASLFVQTADRFQATIQVLTASKQAEATSIMSVLSLGVRQGDTITLRASGADAPAALEALRQLAEANFYETVVQTLHTTPATPTTPTTVQPSPTQTLHPSPATPMPSVPSSSHEPWHGISTSAGVAIAPAFLYTSSITDLRTLPRRTIAPEQVSAEQERLRNVLDATAQELADLAIQVQSSIGEVESGIFTAQSLMLQDPALLDSALELITNAHFDAASALASAGEHLATTLEQLDNELFAARAVDVRDSIGRAIQQLRSTEMTRQDLSLLSQPVILLARDLTPSDTARLRPNVIRGICTTQGGPTAHAAILARALGIPAMAGLPETALLAIRSGDELALDADNGLLYHLPKPTIRTLLEQRLTAQQQQRETLKQASQQVQTPLIINGQHIHLLANIASEAEAEAAREWGAAGVGLLRTEFLFATAPTLPGVAEQRDRYASIFRAFQGQSAQSEQSSRQIGPIVARTLDAGADKPLPALDSILGSQQEANPALGLRGIRISLAHQRLLEEQLRALLLAAADTGIPLHIMFPMITTVEELRIARAIFDRISQNLQEEKVALPHAVAIGIMVEVPAAAIMAPELATIADFFSIGANDLLQYTLACDRTNTAVSQLYTPMQPSVLRLIHQVAEAGRHAGKPVAVCGEIASDPRLAPVLVGLGITELSMAPTAIPAVRAILTRKSSEEITALAETILQLSTVDEVAQVCDNFYKM